MDVEDRRALMTRAAAMGDALVGEDLYKAELFLLRKVAETSSDLAKARCWSEFRDACGGLEVLQEAHGEAVAAYEEWSNESDTES